MVICLLAMLLLVSGCAMNYCAQPRFTSARRSLDVSDRQQSQQAPLDTVTVPTESADQTDRKSVAVDIPLIPSQVLDSESDATITEPGSPASPVGKAAGTDISELVRLFGPLAMDTTAYTYRRVGHLLADRVGDFAGIVLPVMSGSLWVRLVVIVAANLLEPYVDRFVDFICDRLESGEKAVAVSTPIPDEDERAMSTAARISVYRPGSKSMPVADSIVASVPYAGCTGYATVF